MSRLTPDEFIQQLEIKPATKEWGVVLAFDRNKANYLLMQEYIDRFNSGSYFPSIDHTTPVTGGVRFHVLDDLQADKPRLSFENASIADSRANLHMRSIGGRLLETNQRAGLARRDVVRLAQADGLLGPALSMKVKLNKVTGGIDSAGKVVIDLGGDDVTDMYFSGVDTEFEALLLGTHLREIIKTWTPEQKIFELSEIRRDAEDALQPAEFHLRTHPSPGATVRTAENFGDGEVLVFIRLDGAQNGELPAVDSDMLFLLPEGYSSNLMISYEQIFENMIMEEIKKISQLQNVQFEIVLRGAFKKYVASNGQFSAAIPPVGLPRIVFDPMVFPFANGDASVRVEKDGHRYVVRWSGTVERTYVRIDGVRGVPPQDWYYEGEFKTEWSFEQVFSVALQDNAQGRKVIALNSSAAQLNVNTSFVSGSGRNDGGEGRPEFDKAMGYARTQLLSDLNFLSRNLSNLGTQIDAMRLNNLLFRGDQVVEPKAIAMPGDITVLGELAPRRTSHTISPQEVVVQAGSEYTFKVEPALAGLEWTVSNLPDETGDPGQIDKASGKYKAPSAASFGYGFKRVVVTAQSSEWLGSALVSLVANDVSIYPLVSTVALSSDDSTNVDVKYKVWAASIDGSAMTWTVVGNANGSLLPSTEPEPGVQDARFYKSARSADLPAPVTKLDKILRMDRIDIKRAGASTSQSMYILIPLSEMGSSHLRVAAVETGLAFEFWSKNLDNEDVQVPPESTEWFLVKGDGTFEGGVYTTPRDSAERFIVVAALYDTPFLAMWSYMILPVPFVSFQAFSQLCTSADDQEN
ncbi:hypothetical protein ACX0KM_11980 [Pseudomonas promysalinigenes]